jgi:hypothetical protein
VGTSQLTLVSADADLNIAATQEGLIVEDPNTAGQSGARPPHSKTNRTPRRIPSPPWSAPTCRRFGHRYLELIYLEAGAPPPLAKAVPGHRTPKVTHTRTNPYRLATSSLHLLINSKSQLQIFNILRTNSKR